MALSERAAVEMFHLAFVGLLGARLDKSLYAIKGGANLRFFFGSPRYSEDIDFDVRKIARGTLRTNVERVLGGPAIERQLAVADIRVDEWSAPKQTDTTQRWKVRLAIASRSTSVPTKVEFSRRGLDDGVEFGPVLPSVVAAHGLAPVRAAHYNKPAAFWQKLGALAGRATPQARDVFDLDLLLSSGVDVGAVPQLLRPSLPAAVEAASSVTFDDFTGQVLAFLPRDVASTYDEATWDELVLRLIERVEALA
jgi:hypothetical protein